MQEIHARFPASACIAAALALAALATLPACSLFDRGFQPTANYLLAPPPQQPVAGEKFGSVMVTRFSAISPFDGKPFLYRTTDGTWRPDPYAGFIASPSDMVSDAFVRALEQSGRCEVVGIAGVAMRFDFAFEGVIESFHADFADAAGPKAVVRLRSYLIDRRGVGSRLVGQFVGSGTAPIVAAEPGAVAAAMSEATGAALASIVDALPKSVPPAPSDGSSRELSSSPAKTEHVGGAQP